MKFIDQINIYVSSGKGGNGLTSFTNKKQKYKIPDGGNGGNGGNVYIVGNNNFLTFNNLQLKKNYKAENGENGKRNCKSGKNGKNLIINVPLGTVIYDKEKKKYIGTIKNNSEKILIAQGGKKGFGNNFLKNNLTKLKNLTLGGKEEIKLIHLELFIIANVGLLGFPNVGKSLIINKLTNAKSRVDNYEFTTLKPIIGILKKNIKKNNIILSDLPGIIKFSHKGKGLGFNFLKHLTKNNLLFHIINITNENKWYKDLITINYELKKFDKNFIKKKKWLIINKIDLNKTININISKIKKKLIYEVSFFISAKKNIGMKKIIFNIKEYFKHTKYE